MKIPETTANVGAYYGNEEHGHWQPNGVIVDSGVGGGVVGSGDAGLVHAPIYPVPRDPGYMMTGYYSVGGFPPHHPAAPPSDDFADYMWMENEDEFDKQVMQQLEEEALMEQCIEAMLEDEQRARRGGQNGHPTSSNGGASVSSLEEQVSRSTLNPLAAEFVPTFVMRGGAPPPPTAPPTPAPHHPPASAHHTVPDEKEKPVEVSAMAECVRETAERVTETAIDSEPSPPAHPAPPAADSSEDGSSTSATPEVSACDVALIKETRPRRDSRSKVETKKPVKTDLKKSKPHTVKSEPKLPAKKEVKISPKTTKSEIKLEDVDSTDSIVTTTDTAKVVPTSPVDDVPSGPKPINYAAAARANKPKKASTPPATDKLSPPAAPATKPLAATKGADKVDRQAKTGDKLVAPSKDKLKSDKPAAKTTDKPRKNSAK